MKKMLSIAALALSTAIVAPATAATIIPVSATGSSSYGSYDDFYAIDGNSSSDWASASQGVNSSILFNLGGSYILNTANFTDRTSSGSGNFSNAFGTSDFTTSFRLDYINANNVVIGSQTFSRTAPTSPTSTSDFAFSYGVSAPGKVSAVRYSVLEVSGNPLSSSSNPGLAEASFVGSVPEPTTWGMMILGFGLMGVGLRYRQRKTAVTFG